MSSFLSTSAFAQGYFPSARLLPGAVESSVETVTLPPVLWQLAAGAGAAVVMVPAAMFLGSWVGTLSSTLLLAVIPALAVVALLPPLAVTLAAWAVGNSQAPGGTFHLSPAFWVTLGVQIVMMVAAGYLGVTPGQLGGLVAFTLAEAVVLPSVSVWTMRRTATVPLLAVAF